MLFFTLYPSISICMIAHAQTHDIVYICYIHVYIYIYIHIVLYGMGQRWGYLDRYAKPRNGRWTEPADAEDVEAEVSTFSENHQVS